MKTISNIEVARVLTDLLQIDVDAAKAYDQAIQYIDVISIREQFAMFRDVHNQHVSNLKKVIRALDVVPPEASQDAKGLLMESWAIIRGAAGTEGAISGMKTVAEYVAKKYREACVRPLPPNILSLVEKQYRDAQSHLELIEKVLINRPWEKKVA